MRSVLGIPALCGLFFATTAGWAAEPTINDLIAAVKSSDQPARLVAMDRLGRMGDKAAAAVPAIMAALKDPSAAVRSHAAQALGAIGASAKPAVPELAVSIDDPRGEVRRAAILALAEARRRPRRFRGFSRRGTIQPPRRPPPLPSANSAKRLATRRRKPGRASTLPIRCSTP